MNGLGKAALAELIGTFTLVFVGAMAGALAGENHGGIVSVALAHGVALVIIVYAWGPISGAHVNPAVTFGVLLGGKISPAKALVYWIAQFAGGIAAAFLLLWLIGTKGNLGATTGTLNEQITSATAGVGMLQLKIIVIEAILTFFLVTAVYGSAVSGRNGNAFGLAIGLVLTADILAGGSLTGASMNPARTLGPALAMFAADSKNSVGYVWMYFVGPLLGGGVAGLLFNALYLDKPKAANVR